MSSLLSTPSTSVQSLSPLLLSNPLFYDGSIRLFQRVHQKFYGTLFFFIYHRPLFLKKQYGNFHSLKVREKRHSIRKDLGVFRLCPLSLFRITQTINGMITFKRDVYVQKECLLSKSLDKNTRCRGDLRVQFYTVPSYKDPTLQD